MTEIILFGAPGTCARVPAILLEEIGLPFEYRVVRFMKGEHKSPAFRRYNPKGKVPALILEDDALTENVAIVSYLNATYPDAQLMPAARTPIDRAKQTADLCFCSSTLHPIVMRIRLPQLLAGPDAAANVWQTGVQAMREYFDLVEDRLAEEPWWYGAAWSAMDAYLYWVFWRVEGAGFDVSLYPRFKDHAARMEARPATQRALAREAAASKQLESEGLNFVLSPHPQ